MMALEVALDVVCWLLVMAGLVFVLALVGEQ